MNNEDIIKKNTFSGLIWRFGERFSAQLISFIVSIILARILLPEQYGIVAIVTIFITLANVFVSSGLGTSLIQKKDADDLDFSSMFYASVLISIILYLILFVSAPFLAALYKNDLLCTVIRIMGLRLPIAAINSIQHAYVSKEMIFKKFFFSTIIGTIISAGVGIYMAYAGYGVWALVAQYLTNSLIDTVVLFITTKWRPKLMFSFNRFKSLFSYGWKIMASSFIGTLFDKIKGLVIGTKYTSTDLAYYNKGEQLPLLVTNNVNSSIETVIFASISKEQDNIANVKKIVKRTIKISAYAMFPVLFGFIAVAEPMIKVLLTDKWLFCVPYIRVVCLGQIFGILSTINLQALKALGKSNTVLNLELLKKPIYLVFIVVGMFISPLAIALANSLYIIVSTIINVIPNSKLIGYSMWSQIKDILSAFVMSSVMMIAVGLLTYISMNVYLLLILQICMGALIYFTLSIIFRVDSFVYILDYLKKILGKKRGKEQL